MVETIQKNMTQLEKKGKNITEPKLKNRSNTYSLISNVLHFIIREKEDQIKQKQIMINEDFLNQTFGVDSNECKQILKIFGEFYIFYKFFSKVLLQKLPKLNPIVSQVLNKLLIIIKKLRSE